MAFLYNLGTFQELELKAEFQKTWRAVILIVCVSLRLWFDQLRLLVCKVSAKADAKRKIPPHHHTMKAYKAHVLPTSLFFK